MKLIKDPLVHFLAIGLALFVVNAVVNSKSAGTDSSIHVTKATLVSYVEDNAKNFEEGWAQDYVDALSREELDELAQSYIRGEVLYREALAEGLEETDHAIKQRLIQKMEFIVMNSVPPEDDVTEEQARSYYEKNKEDYFVPPTVTFTHIFYSYGKHGMDKVSDVAKAELAALIKNNVSHVEAEDYGDQFQFHKSYIETTPDIVDVHFSEEMSQAIFSNDVALNTWVGPYESMYGAHLALVSKRVPGRYYSFDEVRDDVYLQAQDAILFERASQEVQKVIDRYDVTIELGE